MWKQDPPSTHANEMLSFPSFLLLTSFTWQNDTATWFLTLVLSTLMFLWGARLLTSYIERSLCSCLNFLVHVDKYILSYKKVDEQAAELRWVDSSSGSFFGHSILVGLVHWLSCILQTPGVLLIAIIVAFLVCLLCLTWTGEC
jgi:hypothetical protein